MPIHPLDNHIPIRARPRRNWQANSFPWSPPDFSPDSPARAGKGRGERSARRPRLSRSRDRALVVHDLAHLRPLLGGQGAGIDAQIVAGLHAALDRRAAADFLEPALEILELVDV